MSGAIRIINQGLGAVNLVQNVAGIASTAFGFQLPDINIPGFGPILIKRSRKIDTIIPNVAVREMHRDRLTITNHPVEMGAAITDHAYKEPVDLVMECGFSNSQGFYETYSQDVYKRFLALQAERRPFTVVTGKRLYNNMLITDLSVSTDVATEFSLMITVQMREVILVRLATVRQQTGQQSEPNKTGSRSKGGDQNPQAKDQVPVPDPPPPVGPGDFEAHPGTGPGVAPAPPAADVPPVPPVPPGNGTPPPLETPPFETPPPPGGEFGPVGDPGGSPLAQPPFDPNTNPQAPVPPQPLAAPPTPAPAPVPPPPPPAVNGPSFSAPYTGGMV